MPDLIAINKLDTVDNGQIDQAGPGGSARLFE